MQNYNSIEQEMKALIKKVNLNLVHGYNLKRDITKENMSWDRNGCSIETQDVK